jgi:gluconate 5-dehydrogenase
LECGFLAGIIIIFNHKIRFTRGQVLILKQLFMSIALFDLTGKIALVTGGTHGLGMAMATGLAKAGATIVVNGQNKEKMDNALREYGENGITAHGYLFDVTSEEAVKDKLDLIETEVGPIDILVNNAGIIKRTPVVDMELADWEQVLKIDLTGPFIMSKYVGKKMISRGGGKIINICSMMSEVGRETVSAYAAAKGGLKMLTKNMATEWAKHNIQVNGIGPGYFATTQTAPIRVDGHPFNEFIIRRTPAERWGNPEDLQGAVIFLSSKASDFVNGHILYVDGGILASLGKAAHE